MEEVHDAYGDHCDKTADRCHNRSALLHSVPYSFRLISPHLDGKNVLDLGCGPGRYLELFSEGSVGIDVSHTNLEACNRRGVKAICSDLNEPLPFDNESFGAVFCSHVLEHVDSPIDLLRESYRILEQNGVIAVVVPNEYSLANVIGRDRYYDVHPQHLYSFSMRGLHSLLNKSNFRIEEAYGVPYWIDRISRTAPRIGACLLRATHGIRCGLSLPIFCSYVIVARKSTATKPMRSEG